MTNYSEKSVNAVLSKLDAAVVDGSRAPDARRVLGSESQALRAAVQSGNGTRIARALAEAQRVMEMWESV